MTANAGVSLIAKIGVLMDSTSVSQLNMEALRTLIIQVLQLPDDGVIFSGQQIPVGKKAFVTIGILSSVTIGSGHRFISSAEQEYITTSKETTVSVNAYGNDAFLLIQKLEALLKTSFALQQCKSIGIGIPRLSPIRNLAGALAAGYEERAQIDLTISHIYRLKTPMNRAVSVDLHADAETSQQSITVTVKGN